MRLYHEQEQEQEGKTNWAAISAKLANANQGGALNAKLHQAYRIRSTDDVRQKVKVMSKHQKRHQKKHQKKKPVRSSKSWIW